MSRQAKQGFGVQLQEAGCFVGVYEWLRPLGKNRSCARRWRRPFKRERRIGSRFRANFNNFHKSLHCRLHFNTIRFVTEPAISVKKSSTGEEI